MRWQHDPESPSRQRGEQVAVPLKESPERVDSTLRGEVDEQPSATWIEGDRHSLRKPRQPGQENNVVPSPHCLPDPGRLASTTEDSAAQQKDSNAGRIKPLDPKC